MAIPVEKELRVRFWNFIKSKEGVISSGMFRDTAYWLTTDHLAIRPYWVVIYEQGPSCIRFRNNHIPSIPKRVWKKEFPAYGGENPFELTVHNEEANESFFDLVWRATTGPNFPLDERVYGPQSSLNGNSVWSEKAWAARPRGRSPRN